MNDLEQHDTPATSGRRWLRWLGRAAILYVLVPYLAVTLIFLVFQRKLVYQPTVADDLGAAAVGLETESVQDVQIRTPDGETLRGWWLRSEAASNQPSPLVLYFPGNASNRYGRLQDLREVASYGFDVLIFDYRGYGDSSGSPTERTLSSDARLIWEYAREQLKYDESRIVIFGESLGGAVALSLWATDNDPSPKPAALILTSTFVSLPRTVAWHYPWLPFRYLLLDRWPSIDRIGEVSAPVTVFHGTADEIVPLEHGRELADALSGARFVELPGAGHNDIPIRQLRSELHRLRHEITTQPQ